MIFERVSESVRECQAILMRFPIQLKQMPSKSPTEPKTLKIKGKKRQGRVGRELGDGTWEGEAEGRY